MQRFARARGSSDDLLTDVTAMYTRGAAPSSTAQGARHCNHGAIEQRRIRHAHVHVLSELDRPGRAGG
jgi:hypothetical protein